MKLLFLTVGDGSVASSRVRAYSYVPYLRKKGFKVFLMNYTPSWQCKRILSRRKQNLFEKAVGKSYSFAVLISLYLLAPFFDLIYIQKVLLSSATIRILKFLNKNIAFDFDDALFLYKDITHLLKNSRAVIVSNKYLKEFAVRFNQNAYELMSPVNVHEVPPKKDSSAVVIGWIGSPETSKYLDPLIPVFKRLKEKFENITIEIIGADKDRRLDDAGVKTEKWSIDTEKKYLERMDIGIMPLENDEWSRSKAGYKLLLYMSNSVSCVASPVGVNTEIIKEGVNGFLASSENEWIDKISKLITDSRLRTIMGSAGRDFVAKNYSYDAIFPEFLAVLRSCGGH